MADVDIAIGVGQGRGDEDSTHSISTRYLSQNDLGNLPLAAAADTTGPRHCSPLGCAPGDQAARRPLKLILYVLLKSRTFRPPSAGSPAKVSDADKHPLVRSPTSTGTAAENLLPQHAARTPAHTVQQDADLGAGSAELRSIGRWRVKPSRRPRSPRRHADHQSKEGTDGPICDSGNCPRGFAHWRHGQRSATSVAGFLVAPMRAVHADEAHHAQLRASRLSDPRSRYHARRATSQQYNVTQIPCFVMLVNGQEIDGKSVHTAARA